jgi:predicted nucleic acid-binding protein
LKLKSANLTPKPIMRWLIDSDILIEGERGNPGFVPWLEAEAEVATSDIVRAEFLPGVHAVPDAAKRQRGELFYRDRIANLASLPLT